MQTFRVSEDESGVRDTPGKLSLSERSKAYYELFSAINSELALELNKRDLLRRVLQLTLENLEATSGSVVVLNEDGQVVDGTLAYNGEVQSHTPQQFADIVERGLAGWVVKNRDAVNIPDTSKDERWLQRPDDEESATGAKSVVALPIMSRNNLVGVITLAHPKPNYLQKDHLELVHAIADQAGIAILNAQLYGESQRQARVMTALANSATAMSSTLQLETVLQNILEEIRAALQVEAVTLSLLDREKLHLEYNGQEPDLL